MLLGLLVLVAGSSVVVPGAAGAARGVAVVLAGATLTLLYTRGHPAGYALGGAIGIAGGVVSGTDAGVVVAAACVVLGWPAWVGLRSRRRWWPRLEALLREHTRVEGRVVVARAVSDYPPRLRLTVAAADVPGRSWTVDVQTSQRLQAAIGDPVTVWLRPADPGAAVLLLPEDRVGLAARLRHGGVTSDEGA